MDSTFMVADRVIQNLERQLEALRYEMCVWLEHADGQLKDHARQLAEVRIWTDALLPKSLDKLRALRGEDSFFQKSFALQALISGVLEVWEFYRDRFEIHFGPLTQYQAWISGAEWVAADCYQSAMRRAKRLNLAIATPRSTSPLLQLESQSALPQSVAHVRIASPVTLPRQFAPVPIIVLPANLMANSWGYLSLHHEVGHDVMADLGWGDPAVAEYGLLTLKPQLESQGIPAARVMHWLGWLSELYADFFALWLGGPAFVGYMLETLALPKVEVQRQTANPSRYPALFLRIHILLEVLKTYELKRPGPPKSSSKTHTDYQNRACGYLETWRGLYDTDGALSAVFEGFLGDIAKVLPLLIDTPMLRTTNGTAIPFRNLCAYGPSEHGVVTRVANDLARKDSQGVKEAIAPRLVASAARLAFEQLMAEGLANGVLAPRLEALHGHVLEAVKTNKPASSLKAYGTEDELRIHRLADHFREALLKAHVSSPLEPAADPSQDAGF